MNIERRNFQKIYDKLIEFLRETEQFFIATRTDCVKFCIGYYGEFNEVMWQVVEYTCEKGYIRK